MSSNEETPELKGGHPPAVKVGGMRVVQNKPPKHESGDAEASGSDATSDETQVAQREKSDALFMSGVETKGHKDFPTEAVKHYHNNPVPELQKHELGMKQTSHRPFQPQPRGHNN